MARTVSRFRRYMGSLFVFLFAVTPASDVAVRLGLVGPISAAEKGLLPYESPGLKAIGSFFANDAEAGPGPVSPS